MKRSRSPRASSAALVPSRAKTVKRGDLANVWFAADEVALVQAVEQVAKENGEGEEIR